MSRFLLKNVHAVLLCVSAVVGSFVLRQQLWVDAFILARRYRIDPNSATGSVENESFGRRFQQHGTCCLRWPRRWSMSLVSSGDSYNEDNAKRRKGRSRRTQGMSDNPRPGPPKQESRRPSQTNRQQQQQQQQQRNGQGNNNDPNARHSDRAGRGEHSGSGGIRLNKVLKATHSRREADRLIQDGRVTVNGHVSHGCMVVPHHDVVRLDGKRVLGWEQMNSISSSPDSVADEQRRKQNQERINHRTDAACKIGHFEYVKYWKPRGVICTTDRRISGNIIDAITSKQSGYRPQHRVYPVGRLDKDTTGLILLTSDGRLPNASLRLKEKQSKLYQVYVDRPLTADVVQRLRDGVVITTVAQRDRTSKPLTARTKPCTVQIIPNTQNYGCEITLQEGRNRQIRKMMSKLGYTVVELHRVQFGLITLQDLSDPGDWKKLSKHEMKYIESLVSSS